MFLLSRASTFHFFFFNLLTSVSTFQTIEIPSSDSKYEDDEKPSACAFILCNFRVKIIQSFPSSYSSHCSSGGSGGPNDKAPVSNELDTFL